MSDKTNPIPTDDRLKLATEITKRFGKKAVFNRITKRGFSEFYQIRDRIREDLLENATGDFADLLEVEGLGKSPQLIAIDTLFKILPTKDYNAIRQQLGIVNAGRFEIPTSQLLELYVTKAQINAPSVVSDSGRPAIPPKPSPLPKPSLRGAGAGAGGGSGGAGSVSPAVPRYTPRQVEPIVLPPDEQPPVILPSRTSITDNNPLSVPTPNEVVEPMTPPPLETINQGTQTQQLEIGAMGTQTDPPNLRGSMGTQTDQQPIGVMGTQTDQTPLGTTGTQTDDPPIQPPILGQPPNMSDMATQTDANVNQQISRKVTSVADEQQPSKIDMIPKERLSAENKTEAELLDDINYFYKTFPNELKNISFDRNNRNLEYLKSKHKEIVAKLTAGKKKEEKIGIIISGSEYIKEKLKEIILENSITGLSAKDLIINVEKSEEKQSSDVNSYEFKMGADGKAMAKKEPIYKYLTPVVQQPIKTKPSRIPNTQTKFRSLVTTARKEVANNPFSKPQPKIRLKYSY